MFVSIITFLSAGTLTIKGQNQFQYTIKSDTEVELSSCSDYISGDVVIPSEVTINSKTYKVTSIKSDLFRTSVYGRGITSLTIPSSIIKIGSYAFNDCNNLTKITFEDSDTPIEINNYNGNWISISAPLDYVYIGRNMINVDDAKTFYGIFSFTHLKHVKFGSAVTFIDNEMFYFCEELENIEFSENTNYIKSHAFRGCKKLVKIQLPESLETIGEKAFYGLPAEHIVIPCNVKRIEGNAFNSSKLRTVSLSEGLEYLGDEVFGYCYSLEEITIPNSVNSLGVSAFYDCRSLKSASIGENIKNIGKQTFSYCNALESIVFPEIMETIGEQAFANCTSLQQFCYPKGIKKIYNNTLSGCSNINKIEYNAEVEEIDAIGFYSSSSKLDTLVVNFATPVPTKANKNGIIIIVPKGSGVKFRETEAWNTNIIVEDGEDTFVANVSTPGTLYSVINKEISPAKVGKLKVTGELNADDWSVLKKSQSQCLYDLDLTEITNTSIPASQFDGNKWLMNISLPSNLETVGNKAFQNCSRLTGDITFPESTKEIGEYSMSGTNYKNVYFTSDVSIKRHTFSSCLNLEYITSEHIISVGTYAFYKCTSLKKFVFSEKLKTISDYMFQSCSNLSEIILSEGLEKIGNYAFNSCSSLNYLTFPKSLTSIGTYTFQNCSSIKDVFAPWETPITCSVSAFSGINKDAVLHVLENCDGKYAVANGWKVFTNIITYNPTGIATPSISKDKSNRNSIIFDLSGKPVRNMSKGNIYIIKGKKIKM